MGISELNSGYEDPNEKRRRFFSRVEQPQYGYALDDLVAHVDGIAYRIRGILANGRYVLGYNYEGRDVEIEADPNDFRRMGDVVVEGFFDEVDAGNIDPDQIIQLELPHNPLEGPANATDMDNLNIVWES